MQRLRPICESKWEGKKRSSSTFRQLALVYCWLRVSKRRSASPTFFASRVRPPEDPRRYRARAKQRGRKTKEQARTRSSTASKRAYRSTIHAQKWATIEVANDTICRARRELFILFRRKRETKTRRTTRESHDASRTCAQTVGGWGDGERLLELLHAIQDPLGSTE